MTKKLPPAELIKLRLALALALAVFVGLIMSAGAFWLGERGWSVAAIAILGAVGAFIAGASGRI